MSRSLGRLRQRKEFLRVAASRRKWAVPGVVLQIADTPDVPQTETPRVGFTATKKLGGAVIRNRAKRRLRAAARLVIGPHGKDGSDLVLIARHDLASRSFAQLIADLETGLRRLNAWRDS